MLAARTRASASAARAATEPAHWTRSPSHSLALPLVSHGLAPVRLLTDRVLVMRAGRIVEQGPAAVVLSTPRDSYTRELIAAE